MRLCTEAGALVLLMVVSLPLEAFGQSSRRFYLGGLAGSHRESADFANGTAATAGVAGGVWLTRTLGVEAEVSRPTGSFIHEYEGFSSSFAGPGSTREEIERLAVYSRFTHQRTVQWLVSAGVVHAVEFHPRWSSRLFAGVTNRRVEERSVFSPLRYPPDVDPERLATVRVTDDRFRINLGALTLGGGVAFAITENVSAAPDLRFDYGSVGDEINNGLRTSLRVMWNF
jgi:hypothetical protein